MKKKKLKKLKRRISELESKSTSISFNYGEVDFDEYVKHVDKAIMMLKGDIVGLDDKISKLKKETDSAGTPSAEKRI